MAKVTNWPIITSYHYKKNAELKTVLSSLYEVAGMDKKQLKLKALACKVKLGLLDLIKKNEDLGDEQKVVVPT